MPLNMRIPGGNLGAIGMARDEGADIHQMDRHGEAGFVPGSTQAHGLHLNEITVIDTVYDGFSMKTAYRIPNMGWMNDMLEYMSKDPVHRRYHHNNLTFSLLYAFTENFVLPFSHDEVVDGKGAILSKMPGDHWQKFANLRALYGYMYAHPGKKLLFMGGEIGQWSEWNYDWQLDWTLLDHDFHRKMQAYVKALNKLYVEQPALHQATSAGKAFSGSTFTMWTTASSRSCAAPGSQRFHGGAG